MKSYLLAVLAVGASALAPLPHAHVVPRPALARTPTPTMLGLPWAKAAAPATATVAATGLASTLAGPLALPACTAIATVPCALAMIRQAYVFSLSYGLAAAAIGGAVLRAAGAGAAPLLKLHAQLVLAYGLRLFAFLFWRQEVAAKEEWTRKLTALDKTPRAERVPLIVSTAFFYALMTSPLLFHYQAGALAPTLMAKAGAAVAAAGLAIEAVADQMKSFDKMRLKAQGAAPRLYTGGLYAISRHANYLGEIVFWVGSFMMGAPALLVGAGAGWGAAAIALGRIAASGLGLAGIVFIMLSATKRLEGRQAESAPSVWPVLMADGELDSYEKYVARTSKLVPFLG